MKVTFGGVQLCRCNKTLKKNFWKHSIVNLAFIGAYIMIHFYSKTNEMYNFSNLFYFCSSTLRVSDGLSVHHQESKTVHTASVTCTYCIRYTRYVKQILLTACYQAVSRICLTYLVYLMQYVQS